MGIGDFLFGSEGSLEVAPMGRWQREGINVLRDLMERDAPDLPVQEIAGLSELEQLGMDELLGIARGEAFQDPRTSQLWEGLRAESQEEERRGVQEIRARSQLGGMFHSSPSARAEGDFRASMSRSRLGVLGELFEAERARDNPYTRAQAALAGGQLPRLLEQARLDAAGAQEREGLLWPYTQQAPLAQSLMAQSPSYFMQPGTPGALGPLLAMAGQIAPTIAGIGGPRGGGGGAPGGGTPGDFQSWLTPAQQDVSQMGNIMMGIM